MRATQLKIGETSTRRTAEKPCSCFVHASRIASGRRWRDLHCAGMILHPCNFKPPEASSRFVPSPDVHVLFLTIIPTVIGGCGVRWQPVRVALPLTSMPDASHTIIQCDNRIVIQSDNATIVSYYDANITRCYDHIVIQSHDKTVIQSCVHVLFHCHHYCHRRLHPTWGVPPLAVLRFHFIISCDSTQTIP